MNILKYFTIRNLSVKEKFTILLLAGAYLAVALVSFAIYYIGTDTLDKQIRSELAETSNIILKDINRTIYDRYNDMQILISDSTLANPESSLEEKTDVLDNSIIKLGWYDHFYYTSLDGEILASTNSMSLGQNVADKPWFQEVKDEYIAASDVIISPFTNKETLVFANTISDVNNEVFGVVFAEFSWTVIQDLLHAAREETEIFLFSDTEDLLAYEGPLQKEDLPSLAELQGDTQEEEYLHHYLESNGYQAFKGNGWQLLVRIPKDVAYILIIRFTQFLWVSLIIISIVIYILGRFFGSRFVRPIEKLTEGAEKIGKGDLKQRIDVPGGDEIAFLAQNFNEMAASLYEKTQNLLEEKGKYASILESSNDGIVLFDKNNKLIALNKTFTKMFRYRDKNLLNKDIDDIFQFLSQEDTEFISKEEKKKLIRLMHSQKFSETLETEITITKPNYGIFQVGTKSVEDEAGRLLGRIWVFHDVTEEREAEKSKNNFISVASHKLRTPLTAINWTLQVLTGGSFGDLSDKQSEILNQMGGHVARLQSLVKILMNAAEIKSERVKIAPSIFTLGEVIPQAHQHALSHVVPGVKMGFKLPSKKSLALKVHADKSKIQQVLSMLLENSVLYGKHDQKDSISIKVEKDKNGKKVIVSVKDTGIGIPNQDQSKIFTKFFRGKNAIVKYTEGTGLSLYMAKIIMKSSREKMWFESEEEKGATFHFTLDLADASHKK